MLSLIILIYFSNINTNLFLHSETTNNSTHFIPLKIPSSHVKPKPQYTAISNFPITISLSHVHKYTVNTQYYSLHMNTLHKSHYMKITNKHNNWQSTHVILLPNKVQPHHKHYHYYTNMSFFNFHKGNKQHSTTTPHHYSFTK